MRTRISLTLSAALALVGAAARAQTRAPSPSDLARWQREAAAATITRDDWGIAHAHGHTDAQAVFGMIYAQAEDDFHRVETNYLNALGRLAEAEGESQIWRDLRMKLFIDPDSLKARYATSPAWLKRLMNAWADGLNFYLYQHPDYHGLLSVSQTPGLLDPPSGFLFNVNDAPWNAAGVNTLKRSAYPAYVDTGREETPRGYHALRVLSGKHDFTMTSLAAAAFDSYLPLFAHMIPALIKAYDAAPSTERLKDQIHDQVEVLRSWDCRWSASSVPTSLAVYWGEEVLRRVAREARQAGAFPADDYLADHATPAELLESLATASDRLAADFGTWRTPWGEINRFQRLDDAVQPHFDDTKPSIPVPFPSAYWGSLASFRARPYENTKKRYGTGGNSFVAVVEFGDRVRARAVTAGGESGNPASKHFNDEAERYASGNLRDVYFYPSQLKGHTERQYHPGD